MTILIFNPTNDLHSLHLISRLKDRSIDFLELGLQSQNDYSFINGELIYNDIPVRNFKSVFYRGNFIFTPKSLEDTYLNSFNDYCLLEANLENINSWLNILNKRGTKVINPPMLRSKFLQIHTLLNANIPLPKTCITNSPEVIREFAKELGNVVYKPISGGFYCQRINQEFLDNVHLFIREPAIYQEEISGEDIRVNLLNKEVISSHRIKKLDENVLDYRLDSSYESGNATYEQVELPSYVIDFCIKSAETLGLTFTGIDLRVNTEGQYYLIECNSMPAYLDIEFKTGIPITDYIINYLNTSDTNYTIGSEVHLLNKEFANKRKKYIQNRHLFNYKEVLDNYIKSKEQIFKIPLNKTQQKFFNDSKINNPQNMIVKVNNDGCQLIGVE